MSLHVKIVLPCQNEREWLRFTVDSIMEITRFPSYEIFVLANGDDRTDFSFIETDAYRSRLRLKRVDEALGVGKCINEAVFPGDGDFYVFLDAHCWLDQSDWLERAVDCLERHPTASMVQPEVHQFSYGVDLKPGERPEPAHMEEQGLAYSIIWAWPYDSPNEIAHVQTSRVCDTPYEAMASGGMAVFVRAETFHRLGKYDPEVSGWYPETMDYGVRAWMLGNPMLVDPTVRIWHRAKKPGESPRNIQNTIHGVLRSAYKYLSPRRRDLAELLFRSHGFDEQVDRALDWLREGNWMYERAAHLRERTHSDDWLFSKFGVFEERFGIVE